MTHYGMAVCARCKTVITGTKNEILKKGWTIIRKEPGYVMELCPSCWERVRLLWATSKTWVEGEYM